MCLCVCVLFVGPFCFGTSVAAGRGVHSCGPAKVEALSVTGEPRLRCGLRDRVFRDTMMLSCTPIKLPLVGVLILV